MEYDIIQVKLSNRRTRYNRADRRHIATVFVAGKRPKQGRKGAVGRDLEWRRSNQADCAAVSDVEIVVLKVMKSLKYKPQDLQIRFIRAAGCSIGCPCSPGYVVTAMTRPSTPLPHKPYDISIKEQK